MEHKISCLEGYFNALFSFSNILKETNRQKKIVNFIQIVLNLHGSFN